MKKSVCKTLSAVLSLLLMLSVFLPAVGAQDLLASGEKTEYNGHTYIRVDECMTWKEAKAYCEQRGGYLATITSLAEKTAVERLMLNGKKEMYWLGATDEEKEGEWKWITDEKWTSFVPSSRLDNAHGIEDYLEILRVDKNFSGDGMGIFNDAPNDNNVEDEPSFYCFERVGFIYEKGEYTKDPDRFPEFELNGKTASFKGHTYTLIEEALTWEEAKLACEQKGGYLATVTTEAEYNVLKALIAKGTEKQMYWLGGTDQNKEGTWEWITGEAWSFTPGNLKFDNAYGNEDYLQMQRETYNNKYAAGFWNDINNNNTAEETDFYYPENVGYILEIGELPYEINGLTATYQGHTYTLVEESLTWEKAEVACEKQGGYLATVTSEEENEVLKALIAKGTKKQMYWLGGTDKYQEGEWQWVTGEDWCYVPQNMKFDNANGGESYLQIQREVLDSKKNKPGYWNDIKNDNYSKPSEEAFYYFENVGYIMEKGNDFPVSDINTSADEAPIIYIKGRSSVYNAAGRRLRVDNTENIPDIIMDLSDELIEAVKTDDWDTYREKLIQKLSYDFGDFCLSNDGEVVNGSHNNYVWNYQTVPTVQQDVFSYLFEYDSRLDPWEIAADLHAFISCVKAKTGTNKIHLISRCLGCNIVSAYIARYGYADILSNVFFASAAKGFDYEGEMFAGKFDMHADSLARYAEQSMDMDDKYVTEFVKATIQLLNDMGILDLSTEVGMFLFNRVKDEITPTLILHTFATCPGYWSMINDENYEDAKKYIFGNEMYTTYKNLVSKIDRYHYTCMNRLDNNLLKMQNSGIKMNIICKYGFQLSPFIQSSQELSDDTVDVESESFGATCVKMGETFNRRYLRNAAKNGTDRYISPDLQIDSSTCLFKDSTWYVKNLIHSPFFDCFNLLMQEMCYSDEQMTVFDDPAYPQYLFYNTGDSTCVPLNDDNKNYNDFVKQSFFTYLRNYLEALFDLLKNILKNG